MCSSDLARVAHGAHDGLDERQALECGTVSLHRILSFEMMREPEIREPGNGLPAARSLSMLGRSCWMLRERRENLRKEVRTANHTMPVTTQCLRYSKMGS